MTSEDDRKDTGKALAKSAGLYQLLAENSTDMISKHTPDGVYTYASPACRSLLGYEPEDFVGRSAYEFFYPEDLERISNAHSAVLERPNLYTVSYRIRGRDGSYTWFETTSRTIREPETGGVLEIIAVSRDIAERKRVEGVLRKSQEALRQSEEFHRFAVEAGRIGTWDLDLRTEECLISPKMAELMDFPPDQTTVPGSRWREAIVPDDRASMASALAASIESDAPFDLEFRVALKDGTERWLYSRGGVSRDASGKALHVHGASIDVTERKRVEEAVRESNERVTNILESITDAFFALDREWRFTYVNRQAEHILQMTREELLGKNPWKEFPEAAASRFYEKYHEAAETGAPVHFEEFYRPLGHWAEVHAYPSADGLTVYFRDASESRRSSCGAHGQGQSFWPRSPTSSARP